MTTRAQKTKRTRTHKKAITVMDQNLAPFMTEWEAKLDELCPSRDADLAQFEAERDAIIAKAEAEYVAKREARMARFNADMQTVQEKYHEAYKEQWALYTDTMKAVCNV